jgi:hypothetical protein
LFCQNIGQSKSVLAAPNLDRKIINSFILMLKLLDFMTGITAIAIAG